jgi:hypothetical protein
VAVDRDDAVAPLREGRLVHARAVVEAVEERIRRKLEKIAPARDVFREQYEVVAAILLARVRLVAAVAPLPVAIDGDIRLDAKDRLHARILGLHVELHRAEHVAVVGDRDRVHAEFLHTLEQSIDGVATVEQRVLGVEVEMCEDGFAVRNWCCSFSHRSASRNSEKPTPPRMTHHADSAARTAHHTDFAARVASYEFARDDRPIRTRSA